MINNPSNSQLDQLRRQAYSFIEFASDALKQNTAFMSKVIANNPTSIQYVPYSDRRKEDYKRLATQAIRSEPNVYLNNFMVQYIAEEMKNDPDLKTVYEDTNKK